MKIRKIKNWTYSVFTDILNIQGGMQPPKNDFIYEPKDGYVRLLQIRDFGRKPIPTYVPYKENIRYCYENDILIARYGASIGRIVTGMEGSYNVALAKVLIPDLIIKRYVFWYLNSSYFQTPILGTQRTAQNGFNKEDLSNILFPLPPLPEQKRIVAKLDTLFGHLDQLKTRLENIPQLLKNFRQAVLTQAVTGKLTEDWREGKELEEWETLSMSSICNSITDGDHQAPPKVEKGIPFLVISNISKGYLNFESVTRYVNRNYFDSLKPSRVPQKGDVLYSVTGSYGIAILVEIKKDFCFQRHIAILKPDLNKILSHFLQILLSSQLILTQAHSVATGTAQKTVPLKGIRNFKAKIPAIEEQKEIVKRVESLFKKVDKIEARYKNLKEKIDTLPQAILSKAFKGELVEQLPTDGDAKDLLAEIGKLKAEMNITKKRKK